MRQMLVGRAGAVALACAILTGCSTGPEQADPSLPEDGGGTFVGSPAEYTEAVATCLRESGWDVTVEGDGLSLETLEGEQRAVFAEARENCDQQVGTPPKSPPLTEAEIRQEYAFQLELRECLAAEGYVGDEPSSEEEFVERYETGPWLAYDAVDVAAISPQEWERLNEVCPQTRPTTP